MPDNLKTFLDMVQTVGLMGAIVGTLRLIAQRRYSSLSEAAAVLTSSVVVAVLVGLGVRDSSFPPALQYAIVGFCSLIADELLIIVSSLARTAKDDPSKLVEAARIILKGGKP